MPVKKIALCLLLVSSVFTSWAQYEKQKVSKKQEKKEARREQINLLMKKEEDGELVFIKQNIFGFKLVTDGWGLSYEYGRYKSNKKTLLF